MIVLDHEPYSWFLLEDGDSLFLDASCNHGPVGYSVMIRLDQSERDEFNEMGQSYINRLAQAIQDSAPHVIGSSSQYSARDVSRSYSEKMSEPVSAWHGRAAPRSGGSGVA